ncbi:uncharacterized protein [Antedon mediterranea]|uniref:uncharacterized protein n=1 Tax=Antedon mediterranea TaxID=105859 RepID=UPI003AF73619
MSRWLNRILYGILYDDEKTVAAKEHSVIITKKCISTKYSRCRTHVNARQPVTVSVLVKPVQIHAETVSVDHPVNAQKVDHVPAKVQQIVAQDPTASVGQTVNALLDAHVAIRLIDKSYYVIKSSNDFQLDVHQQEHI